MTSLLLTDKTTSLVNSWLLIWKLRMCSSDYPSEVNINVFRDNGHICDLNRLPWFTRLETKPTARVKNFETATDNEFSRVVYRSSPDMFRIRIFCSLYNVKELRQKS
jgi:hypothetical protein